MESGSLRRNAVWTLAGNVVFTVCRWGLLALLAKLGTTTLVGRFVLGLALAEPIFYLAGLQLRMVQATDARRDHAFRDYLVLRYCSVVVALVLLGCFALVLGYGRQTWLVVMAVGLFKAVDALSDPYYGLFQQRERMDRIARSMILRGVSAVLVFAPVLWVTGDVVRGLVAISGVWLLGLLFFDRPAARAILAEDAARPSRGATSGVRLLYDLARLALPLGLAGLLVSLHGNVIRYSVESFLGEGALGMFGAMGYVTIAGHTLIDAIGQVANPRLARHHAAGERSAYRRLLLRVALVGAAVGVSGVLVAWLLGGPLLQLLYTAEYRSRPDVFVWLTGAAAISYVSTLLSHGVAAKRNFSGLTIAGAGGAVVAVVASFLLVPRFGLAGAAWSVGATSLATLTLVGAALLGAGRSPARSV